MKKDDGLYIEVDILGDSYKLRSDTENLSQIKKVAIFLDKQMRTVSNRFPNYNKTKVAVLVALNLADELLKESEENLHAQEKIEQLLHSLDSSL